ncbi:MAG: SDR family oxidoreductase [Dehalococcoidia bacterium]|nr:SDR family oxidoreductase [Dehalococcoidia bacterium]
MNLGIAGKTALVSAASRGIGKAIAVGMAKEGANLVICARNEDGLRKTAKEIESSYAVKILPIIADLTKGSEVKSLIQETVDHFGWIDILVTNAGGPPSGPSLNFSDQDWEHAMILNLLSTVRLCREVIPIMQRQGWGRIINMVSVAAKQPLENMILSNSIRAAVLGLAKTLSQEVAKENILINSICPGWILTDRLVSIVKTRAESKEKSYEDELASITAGIPIQRCGTPEEVANLAIFLASERASYITGTTIQIDGGLIKGLL